MPPTPLTEAQLNNISNAMLNYFNTQTAAGGPNFANGITRADSIELANRFRNKVIMQNSDSLYQVT